MVCSVAKVQKGREQYYTNLSREDYYTNGGEPPGKFLGEGSEELGLTELIHHKDKRLHALFQGIDPRDGSTLRHGAYTERVYRTKAGEEKVYKPVCAYDFTLSAPKSVSVLWALSEPEVRKMIEAAHDRAVRKVAHYLEEQACFTRSGTGGKYLERVKPVFAAFQHSTSRELDPQLHTHLLLVNTGIREDGRGGAIDGRELFKRSFTAGQIYRDTLRDQLIKDLHVQTIDIKLKKGVSFEIEGVPERLCLEFSKRRQQIEKLLQPNDTSKQIQTKVLKTRKSKLKDVHRDDLFRLWQGVGREYGFEVKKFLEESKKRERSITENRRFGRLTDAVEKITTELRLEEYRLTREKYWQKIDQAFEKARRKTASRQARFQRKITFLYATHKISRSDYLKYTKEEGLPKSKLGIHFAYATYQISRKQQQYLLEKYGHSRPREPTTPMGINWAYATYRISEGKRFYLLAKYGHLRSQAPNQPASPQIQPSQQNREQNRDRERER